MQTKLLTTGMFLIGVVALVSMLFFLPEKDVNLGAPPVVPNRINNLYEAFLADVAVWQADYLATHNRYFQGIAVLDEIPTGDTVPDWSRHPQGQAESWADVADNLPTTVPYNISISSHRKHLPDGGVLADYAVRVEGIYNGLLYSRVDRFGQIEPFTGTWTVSEVATST